VGYLGLLDVGVRGAVTKYVATYHAAREDEEAGRIASAALVFFGSAGLLAIVLSAVIGYAVLPFFEVPGDLRPVLPMVLVLGGASVAASLVSGVFGGVVVGVQRFDRANALAMAVGVLRAAGVVGVLELGGGLVGLAAVQLAASVLQGAAIFAASRSLYPELRSWRGDWTRSHLRLLLTFGITSSLSLVGAMVSDYSDSVVIGTLLTVGEITPFAIAATLCSYARGIVSGISYTVTPTVGALVGRGELERIAGLTLAYARYATIAVLPIFVTFVLRGASFIGLWMEPQYAEAGGEVLAVLTLSIWAFAGFQVLVCASMGLHRHRGLVPVFALEALVNVVLSVLLAGPLGLAGVAWGTALPRLATCLVFGPLHARRHIGIALSAYWREVLLRPSLAVIPFALASWAVELRWPAADLARYFAQVLATLPLAALGVWVVALRPDERRIALAAVGRALGTPGMARRNGSESP
jgi:O-antigen/teichoic acid export membrane protein